MEENGSCPSSAEAGSAPSVKAFIARGYRGVSKSTSKLFGHPATYIAVLGVFSLLPLFVPYRVAVLDVREPVWSRVLNALRPR